MLSGQKDVTVTLYGVIAIGCLVSRSLAWRESPAGVSVLGGGGPGLSHQSFRGIPGSFSTFRGFEVWWFVVFANGVDAGVRLVPHETRHEFHPAAFVT